MQLKRTLPAKMFRQLTLPQPTIEFGVEVINLGRLLGNFECCDCKTTFPVNDYNGINCVYLEGIRIVYGQSIVPDPGNHCAMFLPECPKCGAIATYTTGNVQL